jgi:hypothetical protein
MRTCKSTTKKPSFIKKEGFFTDDLSIAFNMTGGPFQSSAGHEGLSHFPTPQ